MNAHLIVLRHLWVLRGRRPYQLVVNGVFEPFLYLMSIGVGLGALVELPEGAGPPGTTYAAFVAPALLATAAMNGAVNEVVNDVWWRLRFEKVYQSMLTTPLTVSDIALGEVAAADIPPTSHSVPLTNVLREDVVVPGVDRDEALAGAPDAADQRFRVPRILDEEAP